MTSEGNGVLFHSQKILSLQEKRGEKGKGTYKAYYPLTSLWKLVGSEMTFGEPTEAPDIEVMDFPTGV